MSSRAGRSVQNDTIECGSLVCPGRQAVSGPDVARRAEKLGQPVEHQKQNALAGTVGEVIDRLGAFGGTGATTTYLQLHDRADFDQLELIASEVMPKI